MDNQSARPAPWPAGSPSPVPTPPLRCANIELHPAEFQVIVDGGRLALTVREFEVLFALAEHLDRVVKRAYVYERVWGGRMKHRERAVDVFVRKIRTKLAEAAPEWLYIHTHFGIGYRFAPEQRVDHRAPHGPPGPR